MQCRYARSEIGETASITVHAQHLPQVAAYNRQGVGPFSDSVELLVDSEQLFQRPLPRPEKAPGLDLAAQEVE